MKTQYITYSPTDTFNLANNFSDNLSAGNIVGLSGELGSGKTLFTKGIALGLGVKEIVNSPTFKLIGEYDSNPPLYHFDFYRLSSASEALALGLDHYFQAEGIVVVEWANLFPQIMPKNTIWIDIEISGEHERNIIIRNKIIETSCN
ncbi:MAG: tRNA (adenosine(37)-N6)-threonylcarbamoyltransferase complex ATPase subunit type 1 TsaE [Candidatus Marinimicrobia bacterium]|nr:tRNA (adenosine(37)-N6)-threonylcarbamoyltransferase complex ATPase subunit type 1 TsaE [Candidatus Neomarinimicrobiota bacterium]|tara:strand:- start:25708 stop:26148 length:441 start_codon:yes stop_codon:yes gene_type:complete